MRDWDASKITLWDIERDIGEFLGGRPAEEFDFIHMSHVIEHIPKYSLFWVVDALYRALKTGGMLLLRTPNMEGPTPNSSLYVTLAHEYGFCGSNLRSLLDICGFDDICFHSFGIARPTIKQRFGSMLRRPILKKNQFLHRLFGVNVGGQFGTELVVSGKRGSWPPYFDVKFR